MTHGPTTRSGPYEPHGVTARKSLYNDHLAGPEQPDRVRLSAAAARLLAAVCADGPRAYTARAMRTLRPLERAGLVTVTRDSPARAPRGGISFTDRLVVTATDAGRARNGLPNPGRAGAR